MKNISFDVILEDAFVVTEFACVVDPIRVANRVIGKRRFSMRALSQRGGGISSSSGAMVESDRIPRRPECDIVVFLGNSDPSYPQMDVSRYLPRYRYANARIVLLSEAASRFIAANPTLASDATTHWENRLWLEEQRGVFGVRKKLETSFGDITTSAGMAATTDTIFMLLREHMTPTQFAHLTDIFLHQTVRQPDTLQTVGTKYRHAGNAVLNKIMTIMQNNIETPLKISEICRLAGVSHRKVERLFRSRMDGTPVEYYREMRLNRAQYLLLNSDLSVGEVAITCGFKSGFSAVFKKAFGQTPRQLRQSGRKISGA